MIGAWLLLPPYAIAIAGLPDYSKTMAASLGVVLGTLIFAPDRLLSFRPRWFDLPMARVVPLRHRLVAPATAWGSTTACPTR